MFKILSAAAAAAVLMCGLATPAAAGVVTGGLVKPADRALIDPSLAPSHRSAGDVHLVHDKHYYRDRYYYPRRYRRHRGWSGVGVVITIPAYPYYRYYDDDYPYRTYRRSRTRYYSGRLEPWTRAWYRYCRKKYRSFNSKTGYYKAYSGRYRFCR